jgi:hypothetical protein
MAVDCVPAAVQEMSENFLVELSVEEGAAERHCKPGLASFGVPINVYHAVARLAYTSW